MNEIKWQSRQLNKPNKQFANPPQPDCVGFQSRVLMPCEKPSKLIEDILQRDLLPPLMKEQSRTKSVPHRVRVFLPIV